MIRALSPLLVALAWWPVHADLTVKIDPAGGAPRITVNGQPVRARMFFGNPGARLVQAGPEGGTQTFDFTASGDAAGNGTLHFRFAENATEVDFSGHPGGTAGEIDLGALQVTDVTTGQTIIDQPDWDADTLKRDWLVFPPKSHSGTVAPKPDGNGHSLLQVMINAIPGVKWDDFHLAHQDNLSIVAGHQYHVSLWVSATPARRLSVAFYRPGQPYTFLGGPPAFEEQIKLAADAGVNFVSFNVSPPWNQPGQDPDWNALDGLCRTILAVNPNALLIPRIHVQPPAWWDKAHPDDMMERDSTSEASGPSPYSPIYRHDAAEQLDQTVRHLESAFGDHIAGYHVAGQNTDEWFYQKTWGRPLNGYGKAEVAAWRDWVAKKYPTDGALQAAWADPQATLEAVTTPSPEMRRASPAGSLRDPTREQEVIDFTNFQQEMMADTICQLAQVVRQDTGGRKLVLFFYGYGFTFTSVGNGPGVSGHYALRQVLDSPDIDLICAPISYSDRQPGGGGPTMQAGESVALAGKMLLREDDTFTYLAEGTPPGFEAAPKTQAATRETLRRNVADEALRNYATWWMDLGAIGWFDDPLLWKEMSDLSGLGQAMLNQPRTFQPDVAAVLDEQTMQLVTPAGVRFTAPEFTQAQKELDRLGAPYGQYLQDDVVAGRVPAKLLVFLDAWRLDAPQRQALLGAIHGRGKVWCYAPGYLDGDKPSLEAMTEMTGFKFREITGVAAMARPTSDGAKLGLTEAFGSPALIKPLFAVADAKPEETLATYPDGSAAVALRDTPDGPSLFVGVPGLTSELLRALAQKCQVHLYTASDCNVTANGPFIVLHGAADGDVQLDVGAAAPVFDEISGAKVGDGPTLTLTLKTGETRVLRVGP